MTPPIKDLDKTVKSLEDLSFFRSFAAAAFNRHVEAVYYKNTDADKDAKRALLITPKDTQISICNKQLLFFFSLQKFTQQTEERISFAKGTDPIDPEMIRLKVQLSPALLYHKNGSPIGKRYISVPHIDESKLANLKNFTFTHGSTIRLYCFGDRKQIKVEAIDEAEGNRAINELLKLVRDDKKLGTAEEHGYTGKPPKDTTKPILHGIKSTANQLHIKYPGDRGSITFYI